MAHNNTQNKEIFFHVGTAKTGSTFLQYRVFPKFKGLYYIQRTRFRRVDKIIANCKDDKILVSAEFDQQFEDEVSKFGSKYPNTTAIVVFRRHDSYIASQYRRFVKNGFTGSFKEFFDLENDQGYFRQLDLDYMRMIRLLEEHFNKPPMVLFYDDMFKDSRTFIEQLTNALNVELNYDQLNLSKKHTSYNEKQLKGMQAMGKRINLKKRRIFKNGVLHFLSRLYLGAIRYSTLHISKFLPIVGLAIHR